MANRVASYELIKLVKENAIAWLIFNRPKKKNAMNPRMHSEIKSALADVESDSSSRVLVVTGTGDSFCSGLDVIESFSDTYDHPEQFYRALNDVSAVDGWNMKLRFFSKPTIASVNGYCFAGGFNVLSACDLAVASEEAKFGVSEINFGHIPAGGTTWSVSEFVHPKHALDLILTGRIIDAKEAVQIGLINRAVPKSKLREETVTLAEVLKSKHPAALRTAKLNYLLSRRLGPDLQSAITSELAMLHENTYFTEAEWIKVALEKFRAKEFKPGLETFKRSETTAKKARQVK
jgi:feruloyl-CoA hydratase/lyase